MRKVSILIMGSLLVIGVLVAGCGSSGSSSSSSSGETTAAVEAESETGATTPAAEESTGGGEAAGGEPITIGTVCSCSGAFAASLGSIPDIAKVWEEFINENGGINGHPVKVIVEDDGGNAAKSQQAVRKLVEQDHVQAIVGEQSASFDSTWEDYVAEKGVPVVGGNSFTLPMETNPDFFPSGGNYVSQVWGLVEMAKKYEVHKLAVLACAESPFCANYGKQVEKIGAVVDPELEVVYSTKIAATSPKYTSQCLAAESAGADGMYVGHGGEIVERVVEECVNLGYEPKQLQVGGDVNYTWVNNPVMNNVQATQFNLPLFAENTPGAKVFHEAIAKYDPGLPEQANYTSSTLGTWAGLQLFAAAAEVGKLGPESTGEDVKKGLYALPKGETVGGLAPPLTFEKGKPTSIPCFFREGIENEEWVTPEGPEAICMPDSVAPEVGKAFEEANS
jgi:branched-chain amino acid transport system substrate-binding protein